MANHRHAERISADEAELVEIDRKARELDDLRAQLVNRRRELTHRRRRIADRLRKRQQAAA